MSIWAGTSSSSSSAVLDVCIACTCWVEDRGVLESDKRTEEGNHRPFRRRI